MELNYIKHYYYLNSQLFHIVIKSKRQVNDLQWLIDFHLAIPITDEVIWAN